MKITINCSDDTRIIGFVTIGGVFNVWAHQHLELAEDGMVIDLEENTKEQEHE